MTYTLHLHPLSSFCMKVEVAFYDARVPFESVTVDLGDHDKRAAYLVISPLGKIPALVDHKRGATINETSIMIEYLALNLPAARRLVPTDAKAALTVRELDRHFDLYVQQPMQKIVGDIIRPASANDPFGVKQAQRELDAALGVLERRLPASGWATGETFTMADCAAAPALFYANKVAPFEATHPNVWRYFQRLEARPSFARALAEAQPFFHLFPGNKT